MATKKPRGPVTREPELFEQVAAYQDQYGITSLSKAIRQLVRLGIESLESGKKTVRFREDGYPARPPREPELPEQERELLEAVRGLVPAQKAALLHILELAGKNAETERS